MTTADAGASRQRHAARPALPATVCLALAYVFDVPVRTIEAVRIVPHSRFARLHGRRVAATTRRGTIFLAGSLQRFAADPELVLHEYFHVLAQWNRGRMTALGYLVELMRHGYFANRFEVEARAFTNRHVLDFVRRLREGVVT